MAAKDVVFGGEARARMVEAVLVSLSIRLTITRSARGRSFIASPWELGNWF